MYRSITCTILFLGVSLTAYSQVIDQNRTQLSSKLYSDATLSLEANNYTQAEELFPKPSLIIKKIPTISMDAAWPITT